MAKADFYAVAKGRQPGIYASWEDCELQVKGFLGARYKKFKTLREAEAFVDVSSSTAISTVSVSSSGPILSAPGTSSRAQVARRVAMAKPDVSTEDSVSEEGYDVVYADGACKGNGQAGSVAGIGVWWGHNDPRNIAERCPGVQTNNRAELIAIVRVLEKTPSVGRPLMIKTDSTYSIKCLREWHQTWAHNNWMSSSGKPVVNAALIQYILSLLCLRHLQGNMVKFVYVKGHAGIEGNEGADRLANEGARMSEVAERDWEEERRRVEGLVEELQSPAVFVEDKVVQTEIPDESDQIMEETEPDTDVADSQTSVSSTSTIAVSSNKQPKLDVDAITKEPLESTTSSIVTLPKVQSKQPSELETDASEKVVIYDDEFSIDDLLDPDELEKELLEG